MLRNGGCPTSHGKDKHYQHICQNSWLLKPNIDSTYNQERVASLRG